MKYKIMLVVLGVLLGGLFTAAPAWGDDAEHYPDGGWELGQWAPSATSPIVPATASIVQGATELDLTKPAGDTGVSMETADLGLVAEGDTELSVSWEADQSGLTVAGAVRLFWYDVPNADTFGQAPTNRVCAGYDDAACLVPNAATSGTLSMTVPDGVAVGTVGLTYDASNPTAGTVTFTDLRFGDTVVLFQEPPAPPTTAPPATASPSPTTPVETPPAGAAGELPTTGTRMPVILGVGAGLIGLGAGLFALSRFRRPRAQDGVG